MVPLAYLKVFWRSLELPLINCEVNLILTWSTNCVIISTNVTNQNATFAINDTKLYVPVITLKTQDNAKLLQRLKSGFKRAINFFFSIWVFFHDHSPITGLQGKGEGISLTPHYHFQSLHRHLDISRAITTESSPLHIASSRTRTGKLFFRAQVANWNKHLSKQELLRRNPNLNHLIETSLQGVIRLFFFGI